jgi:hypothetical protein
MDLNNWDDCGCSCVPKEFLDCYDCLVSHACSLKSYSNGTIKSLAIDYIKEFNDVEILTALVMGSAYEI